ncbi:MAG: Hachiman antiphage defense system protein HamA [Acidobacteriota bacterium]
MLSNSGLGQFVRVCRTSFTCPKTMVRAVYISELIRNNNGIKLDKYLFEKIPFFYREPSQIQKSFEDELFFTPIIDTLNRLPDALSFIESHFCEITAGVFAEEVIGLKKLYSKLSLLTTQNGNANKMDLVLYKPLSDPVEFVFVEVKSSMKTSADGLPANHDKSCFADIFNSLNEYSTVDRDFDLGAAKDRIEGLSEPERTRVRKALLPYSNSKIHYVGFAIIDLSTKLDDEISILATRKNKKKIEIDVLCIEEIPDLAKSVYDKIDQVRKSCL